MRICLHTAKHWANSTQNSASHPASGAQNCFIWTPEMRVCRSPLRHLVPLLLLSLSLPSPRAYRSVSPCSLTCFALRGHTIPGVIRMRCGIASPVAKAEIGAFSNSFAMKILYSSGTWLICFHKFPVSTSNVEHLEATCRVLCEASSLHGGGHAAWPGRPEGGREGGYPSSRHFGPSLPPPT